VNTLENRLRDAYRAGAETVRPETVLRHCAGAVPGADLGSRQPGPGGSIGRRRPGNRLLIPLAAAVAVAAVATTVAVLLPRAASGLGAGTGTSPALLTTPGFFVSMNGPPLAGASLSVVNATTGRQGASISLPFPASELTEVATGDGRTFVVAAVSPQSCSTSLYRFSLAADGTPSTLTEFTTIAGRVDGPWGMAVSANGQIAYVTAACPGGQAQQPSPLDRRHGYLSVLNTVTGQTRQWTYQFQLFTTNPKGKVSFTITQENLSISADGSVISFGDRVLDTSAAPGPLDARSRVVVQPGEFGQSVIPPLGLTVAPDGKAVYFATFQGAHNPAQVSWQLRVVDLATGQTRLVRSFPGTSGGPDAGAFDPTGRYLVVEPVRPTAAPATLAVLDLATGQLTQLNAANWVVDPSGTGTTEIAW
jgi:hypothetical protein